ncbi:MAG: DUF6754 domain-containing protein [Chloroflexota bacterium]|nr:DUF6754 domain-containing protein [Chloroflexota bacterium]
MNESILGWGLIGVAIVLLVVFTFRFKTGKSYKVRKNTQIEGLNTSRIAKIEGGLHRTIVLGHQLSSSSYPGLGLNSLAIIPGILDPETLADGKLDISTSQGSLMVFARQIVENAYQNGFSKALTQRRVNTVLPGPTAFSNIAGLVCKLGVQPQHGLILIGDFGPEVSLLSEVSDSNNGDVFAAAGTITSQAALFPQVEHLVMGEDGFMLPGLLTPSPGRDAGWLTEDILRVALIVMIIAAAILKMVGVL